MIGSSDKEAFVTHYNYANCLASLFEGARLTFRPQLSAYPLPLLNQKLNLIQLTKKSLDDEKRIVELDEDYSFASTSWLPVKGYYLLFNMFLTIDYVINPRPSAFGMSHARCHRAFTNRLEAGDLAFDKPLLNTVFDGDIFQYHDKSGANLSSQIGLDRSFRMAMAKIADYKELDWKRLQRIDNFKSRSNQKQRSDFRNDFTCSVFEFAYYMRLRASYRDFAFIDDVTSSETADYFNAYYSLVMAFYGILDDLKTQLVASRT